MTFSCWVSDRMSISTEKSSKSVSCSILQTLAAANLQSRSGHVTILFRATPDGGYSNNFLRFFSLINQLGFVHHSDSVHTPVLVLSMPGFMDFSKGTVPDVTQYFPHIFGVYISLDVGYQLPFFVVCRRAKI